MRVGILPGLRRRAILHLFPRRSTPLQPGSHRPAAVPGPRAAVTPRVPLVVFYFEREAHLGVVRILGQREDIATTLHAEP